MAIARQQQQQVAADRAGTRRQGEGLMTQGFCKAQLPTANLGSQIDTTPHLSQQGHTSCDTERTQAPRGDTWGISK